MAKKVGKYANGLLQAVLVHHQRSEITAELAGSLVHVDEESHAHRSYAVEAGAAIAIVRPDGVVGALLKSVYGVEKYFSKIFVDA